MESLTTKYRPQIWGHIVGQDHIVEALVNSCKSGNLHNAYLFVGTMGTGKTTTARVLAKTLNCQNLQGGYEPCNECHSCQAIMAGNSLDVKELDMATNRGIDDVRILREFAQYSAVGGKFRVFICDEAHQLTSQAASALLKILEEPPKNVIFILCTTELQKILGTIRSRCQVYAFKRIADDVIVNRLMAICEVEEVIPEQGILLQIAKHSDGSVRNAESRLSNLIAGSNLTLDAYKAMFGAGSSTIFDEFLNLAINKDKIGIVLKFKEVSEEIADTAKWGSDFALHVFNKILSDEKNSKSYLAFLDVIEDYLVHIYQNQPMVFLELMLLKLASVDVKFEGVNTELQKYIKHDKKDYDIWDLARWFKVIEIKETSPGIFYIKSEDAWLSVGTLEPPYIKFEDIPKILELPQDIDKNILVEKGLVIVE